MAHLKQLQETAYSYYLELNAIVESQFPEISRIHDSEKLQDFLQLRAEKSSEEYHRLVESGTDEISAREIARQLLITGLGTSYYDEVAGVLEDYIYEQLKTLDTQAYIDLIAELAKRVYFGIHGENSVHTELYIGPFADGYNDAEELKIKELTISAYNALAVEAYENAKSNGIDLIQQ